MPDENVCCQLPGSPGDRDDRRRLEAPHSARSPIHDHAGSTCGLRILRGTATETVFERSPSGLIKPACSKDYRQGDVSVSADNYIHQVSNLQAQGEDLVTLHVYSPPLLRMATYSLTEPTIGEFRPMVLEHVLGSGI